MAQALLSPILFLLWVVCIRFICKRFSGDIPLNLGSIKGQLGLWRATVVKRLYSPAKLAEINGLFGQHHGARSIVLRLLGAKIGKQVSWPRSGPFVAGYELLEVGDNATLGFDCQLFTTDAHGTGRIAIGQNSVISDHVCVLPGVTLGPGATLGFGALTRPGEHYAEGKTFLGCKNGDVAQSNSGDSAFWSVKGELPSEASMVFDTHEKKFETVESSVPLDADSDLEEQRSISGKTLNEPFQQHGPSPKETISGSPQYAFSPFVTLLVSMFMTVLTVFYWSVPAMSSMKLAARIFVECLEPEATLIDPLVVYALNYASTMILTTGFAILAISCVIVSKKMLIGKFEPGEHMWDRSTYCQRWQLLLAIEKIIRECYVDRGILSLLTGTHWLVLYYRALGAKIGKDCALFANGYPSLLITESDLVEIGDNVAIDNAGIISHIDRRGNIKLEKIKIGDGCVLRSGSHLLCGATMENDSCLLEHTLILPGQIVKQGWTMYRRPAKRFFGSRKGSPRVAV